MALQRGTELIWYDTIGRIPIRVGIPVELTMLEARTSLQEFVGFLAELTDVPNADKITIGEAYKIASDLEKKQGH